jgi:8-amino-7-oxononanoate synthase
VRELGLDSLEYLDVIGRIERACQVRIPDADALAIETCRDIVFTVVKLRGQQPAFGEELPAEYWQFEKTAGYLKLQKALDETAAAGESDPFFAVHESISNDTTWVGGRELINFSGNNYLGMSGDPDVTAAAKAALDEYGTSVSASRLVSGTRPLHVELEREIADFVGAEDAITFTSGQATNATVIGHLMGRGDLILHDELAHNSILVGAKLSGATRRAFPHNNWQALSDILEEVRHDYRKVLVVIEGVYSMDGDYPDVPQFIEIKRRHKAWLFLDEAHSIGTMGKTGRGMSEVFGIPGNDIDVWMGTLSKALGACGGYIAGSRPLIQFIKYTCPGVIYTIGLSPPSAAAALTAIRKLRSSNDRVTTLQHRSRQFLSLASERRLNTGRSHGTPIVPVILGSSLNALAASRLMRERGISVQPIVHPAVPEQGARLRFFISALHSPEQLVTTADALADVVRGLDCRPLQSDG